MNKSYQKINDNKTTSYTNRCAA